MDLFNQKLAFVLKLSCKDLRPAVGLNKYWDVIYVYICDSLGAATQNGRKQNAQHCRKICLLLHGSVCFIPHHSAPLAWPDLLCLVFCVLKRVLEPKLMMLMCQQCAEFCECLVPRCAKSLSRTVTTLLTWKTARARGSVTMHGRPSIFVHLKRAELCFLSPVFLEDDSSVDLRNTLDCFGFGR